MKNFSELYGHWIHYEKIINKKYFFFKTEKILFEEKLYSNKEFYESAEILFKVIEVIERVGYDISIFHDEIRVEPNLRFSNYVPPIQMRITAKNCINNIYKRYEALGIALTLFTQQYRTYIKPQNVTNDQYR
jgi:hypothetical protein